MKTLITFLIISASVFVIGMIMYLIVNRIKHPHIKTKLDKKSSSKTATQSVSAAELENIKEMYRYMNNKEQAQLNSQQITPITLPTEKKDNNSEITNGSINQSPEMINITKSKYQVGSNNSNIKHKKISHTRIKKGLQNMNPNMQAILMMDIMHPKNN